MDMSKLNVGDRVLVDGTFDGLEINKQIGTVVMNDLDGDITVKFDTEFSDSLWDDRQWCLIVPGDGAEVYKLPEIEKKFPIGTEVETSYGLRGVVVDYAKPGASISPEVNILISRNDGLGHFGLDGYFGEEREKRGNRSTWWIGVDGVVMISDTPAAPEVTTEVVTKEMAVGDRVSTDFSTQGLGIDRVLTGTIIKIDETIYLVEFDEYCQYFHNGEGAGRDGHCWWVVKKRLTLIPQKALEVGDRVIVNGVVNGLVMDHVTGTVAAVDGVDVDVEFDRPVFHPRYDTIIEQWWIWGNGSVYRDPSEDVTIYTTTAPKVAVTTAPGLAVALPTKPEFDIGTAFELEVPTQTTTVLSTGWVVVDKDGDESSFSSEDEARADAELAARVGFGPALVYREVVSTERFLVTTASNSVVFKDAA